MKRISGIIETGKISEVVMPMLWFEENGYIDGPILTTFHTNLVILPAVMEYMQYIFIALGLLTTIVAALVYYKVRATSSGQGKDSHGFEAQDKSMRYSEKDM
ncbi:scavenger receptor class B member 1-like isoform X2 [Poecilia latipinna]|uniref:scavenger receptor class B member 1-like isoform X2 n=1 Tax=Poecilia latipinna TaxID=48699 RepID=UPI00072E9166|nr:PREDICTED: scavenger receptor class B member 1-like isoform X2 [Poecilia latipinna]